MASLLSGAARFALRVAFDLAMKQHAPAFLLHGPTDASASNRVLHAAVGVLIDTVIGVLIDAVVGVLRTASRAAFVVHELADRTMASSYISDAATTFALCVAIGRAMQEHVPAFFLHAATAAPMRLDKAVVVVFHIASCAFLVVALAVLLLLVLSDSCLVAAAVYLDRAPASWGRERRLAVLLLVSLFLQIVAVVHMVILFLAIA